jgi:hypothetical protein
MDMDMDRMDMDMQRVKAPFPLQEPRIILTPPKEKKASFCDFKIPTSYK